MLVSVATHLHLVRHTGSDAEVDVDAEMVGDVVESSQGLVGVVHHADEPVAAGGQSLRAATNVELSQLALFVALVELLGFELQFEMDIK